MGGVRAFSTLLGCAFLATVLAIAGLGCSQPPASVTPPAPTAIPVVPSVVPTPLATDGALASLYRSDPRGNAKISVAWLTADYLKNNPAAAMGIDPTRFLVFRIEADMPDIPLTVWDLKGMFYLRDDGSGMEFGSPTWLPASDGPQKLVVAGFPNKDSRGNPVPSEAARSVQIVVRDLGGVPERVLSWSLNR